MADTSNVTGRHRGPKRKLRAGYRALSLQHTSDFLSSSVVSHAFSALCVYSKLGHHPHLPGLPLCQISFLSRPPLLSYPVVKNHVLTHSITQLTWCAGNRSFDFGIQWSPILWENKMMTCPYSNKLQKSMTHFMTETCYTSIHTCSMSHRQCTVNGIHAQPTPHALHPPHHNCKDY